jgi:hypothetical protein
LVAETGLESCAKASDFEDEFEEEEEVERQRRQQQQQQQQQASAEEKPQAATTGGGLPIWRPLQGRNTNIYSFVGPVKGVKKSEALHIAKDSSPLSVLMLFFTEIFHLLVI